MNSVSLYDKFLSNLTGEDVFSFLVLVVVTTLIVGACAGALIFWIRFLSNHFHKTNNAHTPPGPTENSAAAEDEKNKLRAIIDNVMEGIVAIDNHGEIQFLNKAAESMFGYPVSELIGKRLNLLMPPSYLGLHESVLKRDIVEDDQGIFGIEREFTGYRKDDSSFPMTVRVSKIILDQKPLYIGLIRDITVQKEREKDLQKTKELAETANKTKSDFLANMSHELRTPLNSIAGMTQLLLSSKLSADQQNLASIVLLSSNSLLRIVNDILDLSKIEANEVHLDHIGFDPHQVFRFVVREMVALARQKDLVVNERYELETHPYLLGDPFRLEQVITNLVGNAIKYTDAGHVDIFVKTTDLDATHVELRCEISDTGIGIAQNKIDRVFDKFVQVDNSSTRRYGGTGLGLAITRELVYKMGGEIGLHSEIGSGSNFWFTLPLEITDQLYIEKYFPQKKETQPRLAQTEARILVAEDNPLNQLLVKQLLNKFGISHFSVVANGLEAVKAYQENAWDIILMDCHMPEKNGYEATLEIRALEENTKKHTPIIAMTANAMVGDKERCLQSGMDEYMSKPFKVEAFKEMLSQWIVFTQPPSEENDTTRTAV